MDKDFRTRIGLAILKAFEANYAAHEETYNPDTCYEAADHVIALFMTELTGHSVEASFHPRMIGPAEFTFTSPDTGEIIVVR